MYFTNICWHEFAKEKPEKKGMYLAYLMFNDSSFAMEMVSWEKENTYDYCVSKELDPNEFHFVQDFYDFGELIGPMVWDDEIVLWAELDPMEEELKSYILKENKNA